MNNRSTDSGNMNAGTVYISGISDPSKIVRIQNGKKLECFLKTDDVILIGKFFAGKLKENIEQREMIQGILVQTLTELLEELPKNNMYKGYIPDTLFPVKSTEENDTSLVGMLTENKYQKIMLKKHPEYLLKVFDIEYEYYGIERPSIGEVKISLIKAINTNQTSQKIENLIRDPHLEYTCAYLRRITGIPGISSDNFTIRNGVVGFSRAGEKFARIPNLIAKVQETYEDAMRLSQV